MMKSVDPRIVFLSIVSLALALLPAGCGEKTAPPTTPARPQAAERPEAAAPVEPTTPAPAEPAKVSTLTAYYHFDEARGAATVADKTGAHEGRPNAGVSLGAAGFVGGGADFSAGRSGQITVMEPLNLFTNTVSIAGWVRRRGPQQPGAALVFCRGGDVVSGLQIGPGNALDYVWNRDGTSSWPSGLTLPDGAWAFVALVVGPERAALYLGAPGQPLQEAVREASHAVAEFSGALTFGRDPIVGAGFEGALDEFGIWKNALSREEVEKLFLVGQKLAAAKKMASPAATATTIPPATRKAADGKSKDEYARGVALYNNAVDAFRDYMQTRKNPAVLNQIEENMRACIAIFERSKAKPAAGTDPQDMIDRCNKMIFDVHMTKQVTR